MTNPAETPAQRRRRLVGTDEAIAARRAMESRINARDNARAERAKAAPAIARQLGIRFVKIGDGGWMGNGFGTTSNTYRAEVGELTLGTWSSKSGYVLDRPLATDTLALWKLAVVEAAVKALVEGQR